jgi:uncharacterized protein YndB with AHSA1/START domain
LKVVLPVGKAKAWRLIATPNGLASWFPAKCAGRVEPGKFLEFQWRNRITERFQILLIGERRSALRLQWRNGAVIRFYLHGRMTTLTLQAECQDTSAGRTQQISEIAHWAFYLANLKSVALGGPDLRHELKARSKEQGFID